MASLPAYPAFDCKADGLAVRWNKWTARLENLFIGYNITTNARKAALLLTYGGDELNDIVDSIPEAALTPGEGENEYDKLVDAVAEVFNPATNTEFQRYTFRHTNQTSDNINDFYSTLKQIAETCNFGERKDEEIKSQLIAGCKHPRVRQKGLSDSTVTLQRLLEFARTLELTEAHAKVIEGSTAHSVSAIGKNNSHRRTRHPQYQQKKWNHRNQPRSSGSSQTCRHCGGAWPHKGGQTKCPAFGKSCSKCGKLNHFACVCLSRPSQNQSNASVSDNVDESHSSIASIANASANADPGDDYVFATKPVHPTLPSFKINFGEMEIVALADSGSTVNILSTETYKTLRVNRDLERTDTNVFPYNSSTALKILGTFNANVSHGDNTVIAKFHVVPGNACPIISWETSQQLGLLSSCNNVRNTSSILDQYPELFDGVGKLKDFKVKLHIDETVQPIAQTQRRVPFHIRKDVERQIDEDTRLGIVEKTSGPTPWVSPIVCVPKPKTGKIRVCVDMRQANNAIKRERHSMPTIDELVSELSGASVFSKLDLNQGYNQLELDESSRFITTFTTHLGLRRYTRLFFGINSAAEVFQEAIRNVLQGITGAINISDDILIFGKTQSEHDENLHKTLRRLSEKGLTLNRAKCELNVKSVEYFGHVFSSDGVSASKTKVDAIKNMPSPTNVGELRSLLGMMNYCGSRFVPDYAGLTHKLRQLTKKDVDWSWNSDHENTVKMLKDAVAENITLTYFNAKHKTELYCDASPVGLCAILTQINERGERNIIQFASRSLSSVESRYSQTEREALSVVFGCEHFHMFLYGSSFMVITDHKPLTYMYGPNASLRKLTPRLERWALRLQPYDITVTYKPGSENPADYLSRHPSNDLIGDSLHASKVAEEYIQYIIDNSTPKSMTLQEVAEATKSDPVLRAVMEAVRTNRWYEARCAEGLPLSSLYKTLQNCSTELSLGNNDNILLKGDRIVLPASLQCRAVEIAHAGHQGITKTVALLREKVWFQGMQGAVEDTVRHCLRCQVNTPTASREPLRMSPLPEAPWTDLSADFGQISPDTYILVIQDEYSRYVVVEVLSSLTARSVIPRFDKVFSEFGIPKTLKTDNGPPFTSEDFKRYMNLMGIQHRRITPLWPRANAETERFMRTIKKVIREKPQNWKQHMYKLLLDYRSTPHSTTGVAPATVLFGRSIGTRLPSIVRPVNDSDMRQKDNEEKMKMKAYADNKQYVKESNVKIGDNVLVKNTGIMKKTPYNPHPLTVTAKKGSMITAERDGQKVTRNSSFFKTTPSPQTAIESQESEESFERPETAESFEMPGTAERPKRNVKLPGHFKDFVM